MRSSQVAELAGVNAQTLRYYERRGLLPDPPRATNGYRTYGPDTVRTVRFVKRAQDLGFRLSEIQVLLDLADGGPESCQLAQDLTQTKIADLESRIATLTAMRDSLQRLLVTCTRPRPERDCALLDALEPPDNVGAEAAGAR